MTRHGPGHVEPVAALTDQMKTACYSQQAFSQHVRVWYYYGTTPRRTRGPGLDKGHEGAREAVLKVTAYR